MRDRRPLNLLLGLLLALAIILPARATALVADLSSYLVAVTTGFEGANLMLFGAIDGPGDVVVVLRGPETVQTVFRKSQVAGIWMNTDSVTFHGVPAFYQVASNRPLDEVAGPDVRQRLELGVDNIRMSLPSARASGPAADAWRDGLVRAKVRRGLFARTPSVVRVMGGQLFRTEFYLPDNVPTGLYRADVYLLRDGALVAAQTTPLSISKVGFEADLSDYAHHHGAIYGAGAIALALFAGWLAYLVFARRR